MLQIIHGNRLETLAAELVTTTDIPPADPFAAETVVVQNQGMARWVDQQLALRRGVSARVVYPLPASFFWRVLQAWLPDSPAVWPCSGSWSAPCHPTFWGTN